MVIAVVSLDSFDFVAGGGGGATDIVVMGKGGKGGCVNTGGCCGNEGCVTTDDCIGGVLMAGWLGNGYCKPLADGAITTGGAIQLDNCCNFWLTDVIEAIGDGDGLL